MTVKYMVEFEADEFEAVRLLLEPRDITLKRDGEVGPYRVVRSPAALPPVTWNADAVAALRNVLGLSNDALAQRLRVNRSTVVQWLQGAGHGPGEKSIRKLTELLVSLPAHRREAFASLRMAQVTT